MFTLRTFAVMVLVGIVTALAVHGLQLLIVGSTSVPVTGAVTAIVVMATGRTLTRKRARAGSATSP
jgi:hypothetical protein